MLLMALVHDMTRDAGGLSQAPRRHGSIHNAFRGRYGRNEGVGPRTAAPRSSHSADQARGPRSLPAQ
jgi:hypothetical protein